MVAFSKLHSALALTVFLRSRPRKYRLLKPENFVLVASGRVNRVSIPQERYLNLVYDAYRALRSRYRLKSFAIYGSVARGTAKPESDVDMLAISEDFRGSIAGRADELVAVRRELEREVMWLMERGIYAIPSILPLRPEEAKRRSLLLLDLVDEARVVYDDGFLARLLEGLKGKLARRGARKIRLDDGTWLWDLKPDYQPYEVVDV